MGDLIHVTKAFRVVPGTHGEARTSKQATASGDQRRIGSNALLSTKLSDAERILTLELSFRYPQG